MPPTKKDRTKQRAIAKEWKAFRAKYLFTQQHLAEALGVSRRTVQYVESGKGQSPDWPCIPGDETLAKFRALKTKFEGEAE